MISETLNEVKERERRKLNLTVLGVPKWTSHVPEHRQKYDEVNLMETFHSIGADVVPESVKRFGKVNPDKLRLLMVKMPTMKDKGQSLKSAWKLNNSNTTKQLVNQARSHPSTANVKEGTGSKASGKEGQCGGPRRLEDGWCFTSLHSQHQTNSKCKY